MAKPLKETPILTEWDAVNFFQLKKIQKASAVAATKTASAGIIQAKPVRFNGNQGGD